MLRSTSRVAGVNCHTDPYSFSGANPVAAIAKRKSAQGISPGKSFCEGLKNKALKTLKARFLRVNTGCLSSTGAGVGSSTISVLSCAEPLVLGLTFGSVGMNLDDSSDSSRNEVKW